MNHRMTAAAALAVFLASVSLFAVVGGTQWLVAGAGAVIVIALAGTLTRMAPVTAAAGATLLGLLALMPLITGEGWPGRALAAAILAVTALSATGQRLLRAAAAGVTYAAALLVYLNLIGASAYTAGGLPTVGSVRYLGSLFRQASYESHFAPPVLAVPGIVLVTAGGIGVIAAVTDLIAVRLRSPAIAGLPLLILFSVPITTSAKESGVPQALAFFLAVAGFLILLATDSRDRLRIWGRLVTVWRDAGPGEAGPGPNTTALSASGRRVGVAAICAAIVLPLVVPTLHVHSLFPHNGSGPGAGPGNPLLRMDDELRLSRPQPVLSYRILSGDKSSGQYLQDYVLNYDPDSQDWLPIKPQGATEPVSPGQPLHSTGLSPQVLTTTVRLGIQLGSLNGYGSSFLPLPYQAVRLNVPGSWQLDEATGQVYSSQTALSSLSYQVTSQVPALTSTQQTEAGGRLPAAVSGYLRLPTEFERQLHQIAVQITRHAATPFGKAVALQNWFLHGGHFGYSLRPGLPDGATGLLEFLTTKRVGFCQQFAQAMADLARLVGIPSRIAVGYTGGTRQRDGQWQVTTADYHSWPELYLAGLGWLRFEPTPGGKTGQGTAIQPSYASVKGLSGDGALQPSFTKPAKTTGQSTGSKSNVNKTKAFPDVGVQTAPGSERPGSSPWPAVLIGAAALLLLAGAAPGVSRPLIRRRRWQAARGDAGQAHAAWAELRDGLTDYGLAVRPSESPRAMAGRLGTEGRLGREGAAALRRIALAEERARYAPEPVPAGDLPGAVAVVHRALARRAGRRARWRARLLPASVLIPAAAAGRRLLDVVTGLGTGRGRIRRIPPQAQA